MGSALFLILACAEPPAPWEGPVLTQPREALTVAQLQDTQTLELLDMSFFARPDWAEDSSREFSGTLRFEDSELLAPKDRESYEGEDSFPALTLELVSEGGLLHAQSMGVIDTRAESASYWDVYVGTGAIWEEPDDGGWSRASLPVNLLGRYVGEVRNCVATWVFDDTQTSNVYLQCSQETAVLDAGQLGDLRAMLPVGFTPQEADPALLAEAQDRYAARIPVEPLAELDAEGEIAAHFDRDHVTNASTSLGGVYWDGTLYLHPAATRHGPFPYPQDMRHGVFSVTKSMAGALAMFTLAERYGDEVFDAQIVDYVPALADLPEWQGVSFSHCLNMVTGTRAGEDLLYEPLELAPDSETAIQNIAAFGDYPEAPGEAFNYATTNTFVLSYAMERYVQEREGPDAHYWDIVHDSVLVPIGAQDFAVLHTRDEAPQDRVPILGLGGFPSADSALKIALLIANEGEHEGQQLLSRTRVREALGREDFEGYKAWSGLRYRHSFWVQSVRVGGCKVELTYMEGLGDNRVVLFPSGAVSLQFTDEFDDDFKELVRAVEGLHSSCD